MLDGSDASRTEYAAPVRQSAKLYGQCQVGSRDRRGHIEPGAIMRWGRGVEGRMLVPVVPVFDCRLRERLHIA